MAFLPSCFECRSRLVCVFERKHPASTDVISVTGSRVSCQEPATVADSAMGLRAGYCSSQPDWSGTDALPCQAIEALSTGLQGGRQRLFIRWNRSIRDIMRSQLRFGGRRESSGIPIYETMPVSLMGCQPWVQWWSHKSWIQDIFSHLHSLHDLYAATATTFLMKITWLLAGIFMYGTE